MTRLNGLIREALHSNMLGASAFAESVRQEMADAVEEALVAASGGPDHLVRVYGDVGTIQHPLDERFTMDAEGLLNCPYTAAILGAVSELPSGGDGLWRVRLTETVDGAPTLQWWRWAP